MSRYLLALDNMCDRQILQVNRLTARTEAVEAHWRKSRVEPAKVEAGVAHIESCVIALEEELMESADHHNKLLRGVYLVERAERKEPRPKNANPPILKGNPLFHMVNSHKRMCESVPPTPPTSPCDEGTCRK
jgi:hypothetical protein